MTGAVMVRAVRNADEIRQAALLMRDTADRCAAGGDAALVSRICNLVSIAQALEWASGKDNDFGRMIAALQTRSAKGRAAC